MNVKELTHSQQQPQAPKTHKKKPTIRQAIRTVFCAPQRSLPYRFLVQLKEAETVNPIENDAKSLSRPLAWLL